MGLGDIRVTFRDGNFQALIKAVNNPDGDPDFKDAINRISNVYRAFLRKRFTELSRNQGGGVWPKLSPATIAARLGPARRTKKKLPKKKKAVRKKKKKPAKKKKLTLKSVLGKAKKARKASSKFVKKSIKAVKKKVKEQKRAKAARTKRKAKARKLSILRDTGAMFAVFQPSIIDIRANGEMVVRLNGSGSSKSGVSLDKLMLWHHEGKGRLPKRTLVVPMDAKTAQTCARILESALQKIAKRPASGPVNVIA